MNTFNRSLKYRHQMERALGLYLIEMFELNGDIMGPGVPGSDMSAQSLVSLSRAAQARKTAWLRAYHAARKAA